MKNIYFHITQSEKNGIVLYVCKSLKTGFIKYSSILISASAFNLLLYVVLIDLYEESPASQKIQPHRKSRYLVRKGKILLVDNFNFINLRLSQFYLIELSFLIILIFFNSIPQLNKWLFIKG